MKKTLLPLLAALAALIPACDNQEAERMQKLALEVKAAQEESKRAADTLAALKLGQEDMRKELDATRASLDEAKVQSAKELAATQTKATEQQSTLELRLDDAHKQLAELKAAKGKPANTASTQPAVPGTNPSSPAGQGPPRSADSKSGARKSIKMDFGNGTDGNPPPKTESTPRPTGSARPSNGVRYGTAKILAPKPPAPPSAKSSSSTQGEKVTFDPKTGSIVITPGTVPSGAPDPKVESGKSDTNTLRVPDPKELGTPAAQSGAPAVPPAVPPASPPPVKVE